MEKLDLPEVYYGDKEQTELPDVLSEFVDEEGDDLPASALLKDLLDLDPDRIDDELYMNSDE
jgi:hypothetical protein